MKTTEEGEEQWIKGTFYGKSEEKTVKGFYDGEGIYRLRFMLFFEGTYKFRVETSFGISEEGTFETLPAEAGNHGPVRVAGTYHFAYFSAYRNVWWSLANEYDLMEHKTLKDWERYAQIICEEDPYSHLRSIHNCHGFYDYRRPWITHCSIQRQDPYLSAENVAQWYDIISKVPGHGIAPYDLKWDCVCGVPESEWRRAVKSWYLIYYGFTCPAFKEFYFDDTTEFRVEVIDTWNMTIEDRGTAKGKFRVELPGREYMAVRLTQKKDGAGRK